MKRNFREFLRNSIEKNEPIFFDGAMGTMIQSGICGVPDDFDIPEDVSIQNPEIIKKIHSLYIEAGSNIVTANTFGAVPLKTKGEKFSVKEYIESGIKIALEAISEAEKNGNSNAHFAGWDVSQTGQLLEPMGNLSFDEAYKNFAEAAVIAESAGADIAVIETMSDLYETKAAILAVKENTNLPIIASMTFQPNLRTLTGADVKTCVVYLESLGIDVLGFNCGGTLSEGEKIISEMCRISMIPVLSQPNAGLPVVQNGKTVYLTSPESFAESQKKNFLNGALVLGGCCGTTPEHIKALVKTVNSAKEKNSIEEKNSIIEEKNSQNSINKNSIKQNTFVCSYNSTVQIGNSAGPQIVGERINPTGKKKIKEALLAHDMNFILEEAESQINAGAKILDVNAGLPGIDEAQTVLDAVKMIQKSFSVPLQIDSSEPGVIEKALRYYNGKALINSVNAKQEVMDKIFPLVKHYGGAVVALCIDENGIAPTAEGRAETARKIIREASKYGIKPRDILIDALTLTISSQQKEALETCRTISILKEEFGREGLKFILGVSNISFGLPRRDIINSRFFAMALYAGLDACIINPLSEPMMETFNGYRAIAGFDENCLSYIEKYNGTKAPVYGIPTVPQSESNVPENSQFKTSPKKKYSLIPENLTPEERSLIEIICKGFKDKAVSATEEILSKTKDPVSIIDNCIVPALDSVGKDFETGEKFLPQLLLSADTVSASFGVLKKFLEETGSKQESKGTIVIATVFGDIHDIGKNIVKAMLENYGYTVIDLGKNVPYETVVETVLKNDIKLLGLSALMTTTVTNMEKTIKEVRTALNKEGKSCKIMVGGAVLTADYAKQIGADYYSKDAVESVAIAKEVFDETSGK